jgi:hypothetical protein
MGMFSDACTMGPLIYFGIVEFSKFITGSLVSHFINFEFIRF